MWENVTPTQKEQRHSGYTEVTVKECKLPETETVKAKEEEKPYDNFLLWAQILVCVVLTVGVLAAKYTGMPLYAQLRTAFTQAMQPTESEFLGAERNFVKFAQGRLNTLSEAAKEVFADLKGGLPKANGPIATGESAADRTRRGHTADAPAGSSLESYRPVFSMVPPLGIALSQTSGYGWRTNPLHQTQEDFHTGADLAAAQGTPVLAAAAGVVRQARYSKSYGNYLRILHADGDETIYAHMQYLFARVGQTVTQGEIVGTVGQTGDATGPHLHFEILHDGIRYDPCAALGLA